MNLSVSRIKEHSDRPAGLWMVLASTWQVSEHAPTGRRKDLRVKPPQALAVSWIPTPHDFNLENQIQLEQSGKKMIDREMQLKKPSLHKKAEIFCPPFL